MTGRPVCNDFTAASASTIAWRPSAAPTGIGAPDLDLEQLFPLVAAQKPLPEVVDGYLARLGRGREARAEVLVALERLVDEGACEVVIEGA